ncbi:MAG: hypothetical protein F2681_15890 [Actinobacteria bacterium]|uniref:Unannotated protein n=1 Tax=freshwater metagenome TaxID=449393 RepID=A0A6J7PYB3_9ZZZZ|nr:hypothetical protein [Actinomycetota bacterium]MSW79162.1 hypothetical protein [Actinomycetota bacterium]MSX54418.1 hypothetical protein [Actinomycetota bacterium]MSX94008.1 hypothetical protein [Actinomycetota bacterium]MSZ84613.1 hypothetical protein [Actinomycetota bacterium]
MAVTSVPSVSHLHRCSGELWVRAWSAVAVLFVLLLAFGKGFAYCGVPPLFVGEVVLAGTLLLVVRRGMSVPQGLAPLVALIFVVFGTVQLILDLFLEHPSLVEEVRGFALVYYSLYAMTVYAILCRMEARTSAAEVVDRLERALRRSTRWLVPVFFVLSAQLVTGRLPSPAWPGSGVRMLFTKATDVSVGLAFVLPFVAEGWRARRVGSRLTAVLWVAASLLVIARSRAAVLALCIGLAFTFGVRAVQIARAAAATALGYAILWVSGLHLKVGHRELSAAGLRDSVVAVFRPSSVGSNYAGTSDWRSNWWSNIWSDIHAQGMWARGTGWSTNLATRYLDPGNTAQQQQQFVALRLPHNIFFSVAGRAGLVAGVLFVLIGAVAVVASRPSRRVRALRSRPLADAFRVSVAAGLVVGLTDVYIESPQGGIVFWCGCGVLWWLVRPRRQPSTEL